MTRSPAPGALEALILAPHGRDAALAASLLADAGIASRTCPDLAAVTAAIGAEAAFVVVTEEATRGDGLRALASRLEAQPSWSDLPCIVLTTRGGGSDRNPAAARLSEALRNVTFLERPFHPTTFTSVARTALKGRLRQFEARARLEELRESEERLKIALDAGRLGSWELALADRALSCSEACKAHFGRRPDEPFGHDDLLASVEPDDRPRVRAALERSARTGDDYVVEHRVVWPDGSRRWLECRGRVVRAPPAAGEAGPASLIGVSSDVTDRRTSEESLRQLNESLEERVAERTAELQRAHAAVLAEISQRERAEEQLRQAQKMEMIGQLTGGVAHDFNNLLMAVLGNLDLLRRRIGEEPKAQRLIAGAIEGARRGASLTQRLLAFAHRQDLQVEPVDLAGLVEGMRSLLQNSVGAGIDLRVELPEASRAALPFALADANQLELALLNLAVNARDAMPEGGDIAIAVAAAEPPAGLGLAPGPYLRLSVEDTGQGMDPETRKRAVEPFFSTKGVGKGTGLGLSMIHGLAVQLKGALEIDSERGRGTRVALWLPATPAPQPAAAGPAAGEVEPAPAPARTVLVVDDDALVAMSTVDMLEELGHTALQASSGARALALLDAGEPVDLVITDYAMPEMTGTQFARAARARRPDLPILLATGFADLPEGAELDLPRLGKPYFPDQLAAEIAKLFGPDGERPGAGRGEPPAPA